MKRHPLRHRHVLTKLRLLVLLHLATVVLIIGISLIPWVERGGTVLGAVALGIVNIILVGRIWFPNDTPHSPLTLSESVSMYRVAWIVASTVVAIGAGGVGAVSAGASVSGVTAAWPTDTDDRGVILLGVVVVVWAARWWAEAWIRGAPADPTLTRVND